MPPRADIAAPTITELTRLAIDNGAGGRFALSKSSTSRPSNDTASPYSRAKTVAIARRRRCRCGHPRGDRRVRGRSGPVADEKDRPPLIAIVAGIIGRRDSFGRGDPQHRGGPGGAQPRRQCRAQRPPRRSVRFLVEPPGCCCPTTRSVSRRTAPSRCRWMSTSGSSLRTWHQKVQVVRRRSDAGTLHVAYVGGIDIHTNRRDSPGHHGRPYTHPGQAPNWVEHPFHDVHARVLGPAAADVFQTVDERYELELATEPGADLGPAEGVRAAGTRRSRGGGAGRRTRRAGRADVSPHTRAEPASAVRAVRGTAIHDGLINAVRGRDYIYIEDQYFTPSGDAARDGTLVGALLEAAENTETVLVLLAPNYNDQPFGKTRRDYLYDLLSTAWDARFVLGTPMRRPWLPPSGRSGRRGAAGSLRTSPDRATRIALTPVFASPPMAASRSGSG